MTNPTLIAQDTPATGYTLTSMKEAVLAMRGLTLDATTGRTVASTAEEAEAARVVYEAIDALNEEFPGLFAIQVYETTWTAGDHSINLPANCQSVLAVKFDGYPLDPWSRDDVLRAERPTGQGGGYEGVPNNRPGAWRLTGFADADSGSSEGQQDYRPVLRLYGTPTTAGSLWVEYVTVAGAVANGGDRLKISRPFQRWVKSKAAEILAGEKNDQALLQAAERERLKAQESLHSWFDLVRDRPARATTRYPRVTRSSRRK